MLKTFRKIFNEKYKKRETLFQKVGAVSMEVQGDEAAQPECEPNLDHMAQQVQICLSSETFMTRWTSTLSSA